MSLLGVQFNVDVIIFYVQKFYFKWKGDHNSPLEYALLNVGKFQITNHISYIIINCSIKSTLILCHLSF